MNAALRWIAVSITTFSVAAPAAAQEHVLWWLPKIVGSYENADKPKTFRLFTAPETLTIDLLVKNESQEVVSIDSPAFKRGVRFDLAGTHAVDVFAEWSDALLGAGPTTTAAPAVSDRIELEPEASVHWRIVLTQAGRSAFPLGTYRLGIRLAEIEGSLSDVTGKRWAGRFAHATVLNLVIKPPVDRIETAASHDVNARIALENGRIAEAERELRLAAVADPNKANAHAVLGRLFLQSGRYREAAEALERALPLVQGLRSPVPGWLALAYLHANDEARAADALRRAGMPEDRVKRELAELKKALAR